MADIPQMANTVNSRLLYGLQVVEESQILYGDGIGSNLLGLMVDTGVQVRNAPVGETRIDTIRRGINATYLSGFPATAIVLHPTDFMEMELLKSTQGEYILENIQDGNRLMLFGCPIVLSTSMVVGSYLIGAMGLAVNLWEREGANIKVSEHHADYFARNMLAILCEERVALTTHRPED
jgi:HK97 family phage major capsid protein